MRSDNECGIKMTAARLVASKLACIRWFVREVLGTYISVAAPNLEVVTMEEAGDSVQVSPLRVQGGAWCLGDHTLSQPRLRNQQIRFLVADEELSKSVKHVVRSWN
jgi:hypothetical protein